MPKVLITRSCYVNSSHRAVGDVIEVDQSMFILLVSENCAVPAKDVEERTAVQKKSPRRADGWQVKSQPE